MNILRIRTAAVAAAVLLGSGLPAGQAAASDPLEYVALGDSSAAGPLIPPQIDAACLRSSNNWPHAVATALGAQLTDVTCSGAKLADLTGQQFGFVAPQFNALTSHTDVVTLAITANDIDMGTLVPSCINPLPQPLGSSCKDRMTSGGVDQMAARIDTVGPKLGAALDEIHRRSPAATVYVVGYGTYFSAGGCWPTDPIWARDADYIQATFDRLMSMMKTQAAAHGASYIDIRTPSASHGICAAIDKKWMEGVVPTSPTAPYHPNAAGMAASGRVVAAAIGG